MKKIIFFIAIILLCLNYISIIAQQYQPIPDSNTRWVIQQDDGWGGFYYNKYVLSLYKNDTVIDNKSYIKIYGTTDMYEHNYYGAFRNAQDGISYYLPKNSQQDYILRDFTKNETDTIFNVAYEYNHDTWVLDFIVDSIDFTSSGPYSYKIMYLSTLVNDTIPEQGYQPLVWMEKIGSFGGGVFNNFRGGLNMQRLYCMSYNDTIYYDSKYWVFRTEDISYKFGFCPNPVYVDDQDVKDQLFRVEPNPFSSLINIYYPTENYSNPKLVIYDLLGLIVYKQELKSNVDNHSCILTNLPTGIYIAKLFINDKMIETQKIIKK